MFSFNKSVKTKIGLLSFELNQDRAHELFGKKVFVYISPIERIIDKYNSRIIVEPLDERSRVISLSIRETIESKGIALINNLIEQYNADAIEDKNQIYVKTIDFLNERLDLLKNELFAIESSAEQFKTRNQMVNSDRGAEIFLQSSSANEEELIRSNTQLQVIKYMQDELKTNNKDLLPVNIGLSDPSIIELTSNYNELIQQRNRITKSSSERNPIVVNIDSELEDLKNNLSLSLNTLESSNLIQMDALMKRSGAINSRIASVPKNERQINEITRQQETKNQLYLFLLQKREESILSSSVNTNKAKIVDRAYSNHVQVSPKKKIIYFASILAGLFLPLIFIYIMDLLDTKVHDEEDIKKMKIPFLGDVPFMESKTRLINKNGDNSEVAEAFRYIRSNIGFMLDEKKLGKTLIITSTKSNEGKSFISVNLAASLAISGKKTILLAMDLRAPKISNYLNLEKEALGLSNYIQSDGLHMTDIIKGSGYENLDVITAGAIPPNPSELLLNERVESLFIQLKKIYEFIIIDTAPVGLVTDAVQLSKFADVTIYVIRARFLDKRFLQIPFKLYHERKLSPMAVLINGTINKKSSYGYGYGYGHQKKSKSWYENIFSS